jgi:hypothetical protein
VTAVFRKGRVRFQGTGRYDGTTFTAVMRVAAGSGIYAKIRGRNLKMTSVRRGGVDTVRLKGVVTYADPA